MAAIGCNKKEQNPPAPVLEPSISSFKLEVKNNANKIKKDVFFNINRETNIISADIIGYTTFLDKDLEFVPTFELASVEKILVNGKEQVSGVTKIDFSKPVIYTVVNSENVEKSYTVNVNFSLSGLPTVVVNTEGGVEIKSKDDWVKANFSIDSKGLEDDIDNISIEIAGRGNSTWSYPKKPYKIKLESKTQILGMPKHKRWVLLANYIDRTMMRNDVAFLLGQKTKIAWTPHGKFVELVFNGKHVGNYYLCEQIRIDENRLPIKELSETSTDITGGYLLELDTYYDEVVKFRSAVKNFPVNVKEPGDKTTKEQAEYITNYFNTAETTLYGKEWLDKENGYKKYIDITSYVDIYLVSELIYHDEWRHPKSTYMFKDAGGKLCAGPMWDHDWLCFTQGKDVWFCKNYVWYPRFMEDPEFVALAKKRWKELYPEFYKVINYISQTGKQLTLSDQLNWAMWGKEGGVGPNDDRGLSFTNAVELMKNRYSERLEWLNKEINKW